TLRNPLNLQNGLSARQGRADSRLRILMNLNSCSLAEPRNEADQGRTRKGHAPRRRRAIRPCHMQENCTPAASHSGVGVVVEFDNKVVEMVVPPEPVACLLG